MSNEKNNMARLKSEVVKAVNNHNLPHAILIECDKEAEGLDLARFTAQAVVCLNDDKPCGACSPCKKYLNGGHPDIIETDGMLKKSKQFTVDAIREIRNNAFIIPSEGDKKIYILKNSHNMNEQAQNALLKILEEPPEYVYFILVTESKSTMLDTILSRVCVYSLISDEEIVDSTASENLKNFVKAFLSVNEISLLETTAVYRKKSQDAKEMLLLFSNVLRDALVQKSGFKREFMFSDEVDMLCSSLTSKAILNAQEVCLELIRSIDRNCNNNLLITRMCYEFKRAVGR